MKKGYIYLLISIVILLLFYGLCTTVVREGQTSVVLSFGKPVRLLKDAGIYLKFPYPFHNVVTFDARLTLLQPKPSEFLTADKKNLILKILKPTELVGGPGFNVDFRHHFSVSALTDSSACFIDVNIFKEMVETNSIFSMEFIKHINQATIMYYERMMSLTHKQMHGRIADALLYLAKIYNNNNFETALSRQDIADLSAMTKESAIRICKEFKVDGTIDYTANKFTILNEDALRQISKTG